MIITPKALTDNRLSKEELAEDKDRCLHAGPCGLGKKSNLSKQFLY